MADQVLVLNASYEPINVCSLKRAVVLVLKEKAEVIERAARALRSATQNHVFPLVIRLVYYVNVPRHRSRRISRRALFARDGYTCQYCGSASNLTIDHVIAMAAPGIQQHSAAPGVGIEQPGCCGKAFRTHGNAVFGMGK